ncbi:MAG: sn-glycerol-3-phosphate ABC transporter ATP-binding protein UgpC [Meiothermus sp.]|nr:sn-glycerol-3-phosphate ABC transporter ATP-binding protein UgpC [Meiothermus sp.]
MATVVLKHLTKRFGKVEAVKDFSLTIKDREFIVLVGPSGCGKTTVLRMIAGLESPSEGQIYIGDRLVNDVPPKDRDVAMVFQNYALYPHMSVYKNMAFGLELRHTPKNQTRERVEEAAGVLQIDHLLERKPRELSGGQRQRVALGRAIVRKPKVFLMDEPLSNLDAKLRVEMRASLAELHQSLGVTTVYVTHDQIEAMTMGHRIVVMRNGAMEQADTPLDLYNRPLSKFVGEFIGSPAMNFLRGTVRQGHVVSAHMDITLRKDLLDVLRGYEGKEVWLGIRPENLELARPDSSENWIRTTVKLVEPIGAETIIIGTSGDFPLTARVEPEESAVVGAALTLAARADKVHVFDLETERNLLFTKPPVAA